MIALTVLLSGISPIMSYRDLYLSEDEQAFEPRPYHKDHYQYLPGGLYGEYGGVVTTPDQSFRKNQLLEYADHCIEKSRSVFAELNQERARMRCGFWWYELNVGEFLVYNLRHTQHHAAQLALLLPRHADHGVERFGSERNEPPPPTW